MKIALIGYGKMGHAIEEIALSRQHVVVQKIDAHNAATYTSADLKEADVAIEFTQPEAAYGNILKCFEAGVPVVCGTTGWLEMMEEVKKVCLEKKQAFFYASNYSIGVNILFEVNRSLARIMNNQPQYVPLIEEIHHIHKLDAPSGTGLTLAKELRDGIGRITKEQHVDTRKGETPGTYAGTLPVVAYRIDEDPGTHKVYYTSPDDELMIMHHAKSRRGFAEGAVLAAEWLAGKKGVFGMRDLLKF